MIMSEMFCPGCGNTMSKTTKGGESWFECNTCGAYTAKCREVKGCKKR
jgi:DNA-directed RNA polymerase subunit M/transcription elongation factor TFIIS